jgi:hypothetical protein
LIPRQHESEVSLRNEQRRRARKGDEKVGSGNMMARDVIRPEPLLLLVTSRAPSWACVAVVGCRGPTLADVGCRGPVLAFNGSRGPAWLSWAVVGCRGPTLADVGCRGPVLAFNGSRGPASACVGCCGPAPAFVGCCGPKLAYVGLLALVW